MKNLTLLTGSNKSISGLLFGATLYIAKYSKILL